MVDDLYYHFVLTRYVQGARKRSRNKRRSRSRNRSRSRSRSWFWLNEMSDHLAVLKPQIMIDISFVKITLWRCHALIGCRWALSHKLTMWFFFEDSKSLRSSKLHYRFKSYGNFSELVDFAYWWSCIRKGWRLQPVQQACFRNIPLG